jgi:hypothetical protein
MASVFISYRRSDCPGHAGRLYDRVVGRVGSDHVFMDIDAIGPGEDFTEHIEQAIGSCAVVLALIGRDWLDSEDLEGRRLDHPDDLVRFEIAAALRRPGVRVIPVLVEGARMPAAEQLPADLQTLARRNAFELRDEHWRHDVDRLLQEVARRRPRRTAAIAAAGVALIAVLALILMNVFPGATPGPDRPHACADDKDNDVDNRTDFPSDPGCASAIDRTEKGACQDGVDNDEDGTTDFPSDPGCSSLNDLAEKVGACVNGKDDDGDGKTDFPRDEQCTSKEDMAERS